MLNDRDREQLLAQAEKQINDYRDHSAAAIASAEKACTLLLNLIGNEDVENASRLIGQANAQFLEVMSNRLTLQ